MKFATLRRAVAAASLLLLAGAAFPAPAAETSPAAAPAAASQPDSPAPVTAPSAPAAATAAADNTAAPATLAGKPAHATAVPAPSGAAANASGMFQVILGLLVVLGVLALFAWAMRRYAGSRLAGASNVRIVGGVAVGTRERVLVVEVADQWIVVGVAPGRVNALATLPRQEGAPVTDTPAAPNFAAWLKQTIDKRNAQQ